MAVPLIAKTPATVLPPWAGARADGWARADEAVVFSDMAAITPVEAVSRTAAPGVWRLIPYEAGGFPGNMIWASVETHAPPARMPLKAKGWHAIFVGLFCTALTPCEAWLKLKSDPAAQLRVAKRRGGPYWAIEEVFFKVADVSGESLEIAQQFAGYASGCGVAYVKLVPLTPDEVEAYSTDRAQTATRTMAATSDGYSFLWNYRPTTVEELRREVERFRGTDYSTLLLHLGGADLVNYPSRFGRMLGDGVLDFLEPGQRHATEAVRQLAAKKINPTKVWIDAAHELGMKVHVGTRPAMWSYYEPHGEFFASDFYRRHPEWRCVDRDARPVTRMSWAVPEVRRHLINVLSEAVALGADGAHVVFNRGFPMVLYEEPAAALFRGQYGVKMADVDEADSRIKRFWADQVSLFMSETRAMLDAEESRRGDGKQLELSVCVLGNEFDNMQYGLDVRRLVDEGLLNEVYISPYDFGTTKGHWDIEWFHGVCAPRGVRVIPVFSSPLINEKSLAEHARQAGGFYRAGAGGIGVWDPHMTSMDVWQATARLGHRDELPAVVERGEPTATRLPVTRLGEAVLDGRFPPYWGG